MACWARISRSISIIQPSPIPHGAGGAFDFYALPGAASRQFPGDWNEVAPVLEKRILDEIGQRLIPTSRTVSSQSSVCAERFRARLKARLGWAFGLEPI